MQNNILNRIHPPSLQPLRKALFPLVEEVKLNNGIPVFLIPFGSQEVVEIRLVGRGGKSFEQVTGVSGIATKMLLEGTKSYSSLEFARKLDEFGAFLQVDTGYEYAGLSLTCLEKHLENTLPLLAMAMLEPTFPEDEFTKLKKRTLQNLEVEAQKTSHVARQEFARGIFGDFHPYGSPITADVLEKVELEHLVAHHKRTNSAANFTLVISGKYNRDKLISILNREFGQAEMAPKEDFLPLSASLASQTPGQAQKGFDFHNMPDSMQATIRVGHKAFARNHPDYYPMQLVTTILGGYFGSRLMSNIREDKGYTYGIYAGWIGLKYDGLFVIQTDVGVDYMHPTLKEIRFELDRLLQDGTNEDELDLVKNYMLGKAASAWETPSQIAEVVTNSVIGELPFSNIDERFDIIQAMTVEDVSDLARKYFRPDELLETVSGAHREKQD
ncbi:MAG: insulinase family protein [Bacteroidia bacterium]|nr:insulinase family protein [Bacteroidia bacterium]